MSYSTRACRIDTYACGLKKQQEQQQQQQKDKHGASVCRSKVYVYYYEFKIIFLMLLVVGLEVRISGMSSILYTRLLCRNKYEEKISIILKL
jgi:hypothetical protein